MKKSLNPLPLVKHASLNSDYKKEDHFSYFESLEQKLLYESEKITNLIGKPSSHAETKSIKGSFGVRSSQAKPSESQ